MKIIYNTYPDKNPPTIYIKSFKYVIANELLPYIISVFYSKICNSKLY